MLFVNFFPDGALLETAPQDRTIQVRINEEEGAVIETLLISPEASAALAALFLAGAQAGERAAADFFLKTSRTTEEPRTHTNSHNQ